jgi:type IV secretory pathway VirB2 component (pilin)
LFYKADQKDIILSKYEYNNFFKGKNMNNKIEQYWIMALTMCFVSIILFSPDFALAATQTASNNPLACTLYTIQATLTGALGKGIATIAIVALGIGLFLGKLSWGLAIATSIGVGMIFGADKIVTWLSGSTVASANCTS